MFTARYALNPYITRVRFVFKGLILFPLCFVFIFLFLCLSISLPFLYLLCCNILGSHSGDLGGGGVQVSCNVTLCHWVSDSQSFESDKVFWHVWNYATSYLTENLNLSSVFIFFCSSSFCNVPLLAWILVLALFLILDCPPFLSAPLPSLLHIYPHLLQNSSGALTF